RSDARSADRSIGEEGSRGAPIIGRDIPFPAAERAPGSNGAIQTGQQAVGSQLLAIGPGAELHQPTADEGQIHAKRIVKVVGRSDEGFDETWEEWVGSASEIPRIERHWGGV